MGVWLGQLVLDQLAQPTVALAVAGKDAKQDPSRVGAQLVTVLQGVPAEIEPDQGALNQVVGVVPVSAEEECPAPQIGPDLRHVSREVAVAHLITLCRQATCHAQSGHRQPCMRGSYTPLKQEK
jgi:hypothetical protein